MMKQNDEIDFNSKLSDFIHGQVSDHRTVFCENSFPSEIKLMTSKLGKFSNLNTRKYEDRIKEYY